MTIEILPLSTPVAQSYVSELAERRLRESPYFFLRSLHCRFENGILTLQGRVPHGQLKQFAESIVSRVDGVQKVVNRVEVFDPVRAPLSAPSARSAG